MTGDGAEGASQAESTADSITTPPVEPRTITKQRAVLRLKHCTARKAWLHNFLVNTSQLACPSFTTRGTMICPRGMLHFRDFGSVPELNRDEVSAGHRSTSFAIDKTIATALIEFFAADSDSFRSYTLI